MFAKQTEALVKEKEINGSAFANGDNQVWKKDWLILFSETKITYWKTIELHYLDKATLVA